MTNETVNHTENHQAPGNAPQAPFFKKKTLMLVAGGLLLLVIIILPLTLTSNSSSQTIAPSPTAMQSPEKADIPGISQEPVPTVNKQEQATMETQIQPRLRELVDVDYQVTKAQGYGTDWAIIQIANETTDPANIVVQKINGVWSVRLGPGTYFEAEELQAIGAPEKLVDDINGGI